MRFYKVIYICTNCDEEKYVDVEYGKQMPIFVKKLPDNEFMSQFVDVGPPCDYCGCNEYSHGKRPKT